MNNPTVKLNNLTDQEVEQLLYLVEKFKPTELNNHTFNGFTPVHDCYIPELLIALKYAFYAASRDNAGTAIRNDAQILSLNDYQTQAASTAIYSDSYAVNYPILGLAGEAGEVANKYKKVLRDHNGQLSDEIRLKLADEVGDCLWYIAAIARDLGVSLQDIAKNNLDKLKARAAANTLKGSGDNR